MRQIQSDDTRVEAMATQQWRWCVGTFVKRPIVPRPLINRQCLGHGVLQVAQDGNNGHSPGWHSKNTGADCFRNIARKWRAIRDNLIMTASLYWVSEGSSIDYMGLLDRVMFASVLTGPCGHRKSYSFDRFLGLCLDNPIISATLTQIYKSLIDL